MLDIRIGEDYVEVFFSQSRKDKEIFDGVEVNKLEWICKG